MGNIKLFLALLIIACCACSVSAQVTKPEIASENGNIVLNFDSKTGTSLKSSGAPYVIKRAKGKFGIYETIGTTTSATFVDENVEGSPYDYYYRVLNVQGEELALLAMDIELFGPNMYIYSPTDDMDAISQEINDIHDQKMFQGQFSAERYAFYFKPGDYTAAGPLNIGYYTHAGGLGRTPYETQIDNLLTPAPLSNNNATCTFWRSAENLSIIGSGATFMWGVSQAAPIRRIYSQRNAQFDWNRGWASGGFAADCYFEFSAGSYSQQQWYTRNSYSEFGRGSFSKGVWNTCYQGMEFGPYVYMPDHSDNWAAGGAVSNVETTPIIREKPFLFMDTNGRYKVFKPALRKDSKGVSWSETDMGAGTIYDLLDDFYVVKPGTSAATMNEQLAAGKHLFITPGRYELSEPLHVTHANTIILGTGYASLSPGSGNTESAIVIDDVEGVTIASLLFDALYNSRTLMQVGPQGANTNLSTNPTLLADVFFRIGGTVSRSTNADIALEINSSDVIGDHFWIWRADHGSGVGWNTNTSKNGLVVNGDYVTIYGLFNEHFQQYQLIWNGEAGRVYFYQCETPYDVPNLAAYTNPQTNNAWASYKVADNVQWHNASMMGIYSVSTKADIQSSMEVPDRTGIKIHNVCNVHISGQGFRWIINGTGPSNLQNGVQRNYIVDFSGTTPSDPSILRPSSGIKQTFLGNDNISVFLDPSTDYLQINAENKNASVTVFDMSGRILYKQSGTEPVYMGSYAKGVYFVTVSSAEGMRITEKILKR
ncbi:MAG: T9SS type A sorting domain-containing protein [Candidatus Azobacteroides sp.]|nr:T9SS type A sorting domain-containing protein [Candidatus Azobacteroides sp.]